MRALVHGGGGSNGDWGIGVIERLLKEGRRYDVYLGISTGALSLAFLTQFDDGFEKEAVQALKNVYLGLKDNSSIYKKWGLWPIPSILPKIFPKWKWFQRQLRKFRRNSIYDASPLHDVVRKGLDPKKLAQSDKQLLVGAVQLGGERAYWKFSNRELSGPDALYSPGESLVEAVLASSAFPVMFQPVKVDGIWYSDGGIRNVVPLGDAIDLGATEIDVIVTSPFIQEDLSKYDATDANALETLIEATSTMVDEIESNDILLRDVEMCYLKNLLPGYKKIEIQVFRPSRNLGDSLAFGKDKTPSHQVNIDLGYVDSGKILKYYEEGGQGIPDPARLP